MRINNEKNENSNIPLQCLNNIDDIDLVLLDMVMPRMGGRECLKMIKKLKPQVPVILASGFTRENTIEDLIKEGAETFIRKPYRMADLSKHISRYL